MSQTLIQLRSKCPFLNILISDGFLYNLYCIRDSSLLERIILIQLIKIVNAI